MTLFPSWRRAPAPRTAFDAALAEAVAAVCRDPARSLAVFRLGLDGFRALNNEYGYAVGDRVLSTAEARLQALVPAAFSGVARLGGDEFVAFVSGDGLAVESALQAAREALVAIERPFPMDGTDVRMSCSVGIAVHPEHGAADRLMALADLAMHAAKAQGGGVCRIYRPEKDVLPSDVFHLANDLRSAIERRQLFLVFQPKIEAQSGRVVAAEALLRWKHPERGFVPPTVFIPVAERFGLIESLGSWVLEEACRQARAWRDGGLQLCVAVNLSARQLRQPLLAQHVESTLQRHGIEPAALTCEITESLAVESIESHRDTLHLLAQVGVRISIDDFGTGYSSLSYLRSLPAREIKIDRSFIRDLADSREAQAIVEAVIRLSHALGMRVVAEGVETERQRDILRALDCDELQGWLFAKPMPPELVPAWADALSVDLAEMTAA